MNHRELIKAYGQTIFYFAEAWLITSEETVFLMISLLRKSYQQVTESDLHGEIEGVIALIRESRFDFSSATIFDQYRTTILLFSSYWKLTPEQTVRLAMNLACLAMGLKPGQSGLRACIKRLAESAQTLSHSH